MLPNLICLGVEKCGTTTLHRMFERCKTVATPRFKEVFYFNRHWEQGLDWYESVYSHNETHPTVVDITPSYFRYDETLERIAAYASENETRFLFLVRNPIYRAFSHYVHDLDRHFGPRRTPYPNSFLDESHVPHKYHFVSYAKALNRISRFLGEHRMAVIQFEALIKNPEKSMEVVQSLVGRDLNFGGANLKTISANSGNFPRYLYGGVDGFEMTLDGHTYAIPARTLVFCSRKKPGIWADVDETLARELISAADRWTRNLDAGIFEDLAHVHFVREYETLEREYGLDIGLWSNYYSVGYDPAPPPVALRKS